MPRFTYTARDREGKSASAALEAASRKDALRLLAARGLQVLSVAESGAPGAAGAGAKTAAEKTSAAPALRAPAAVRGARPPARAQRLPFLQALSDLASSGLSAGEAVRLLSLRLKQPALRALCAGLWERISEGQPLSRAMEDFPAVFDRSTTNLIQAGEATGSLNEVVQRLITHLTEQKELRRQLATALVYPLFMVLVAGGVVLFFIFFLLPRLQTLLTSLGGHLPVSTQILVGLSDFLVHYGVFVLGATVIAAIAFWRWRQTEAGRAETDAWFLRLPLLGPFLTASTALAFSQTLSVLLENGITTAEALRMTERVIANRVHRRAFAEATDHVLEGESLSLALGRTGCFPDLVLDRLSVGENTGNVVPSLKDIGRNYQKQISNQLQTFTKVIASAVLIAVFAFVGFIAFAIVSAVFQLSASFKM